MRLVHARRCSAGGGSTRDDDVATSEIRDACFCALVFSFTLIPLTPEGGNIGHDEEFLWIMSHEEHIRKPDVIHLGDESYSGVFCRIGLGVTNGGDRIMDNEPVSLR